MCYNITHRLWIFCFPHLFIMEVYYWLLISSVFKKAAHPSYCLHWHVALLVHICVSLCRYDSYGRLTNVTYPTGQVSSYRTDTDSSVRIQTECSNKEEITVTTNLSASGTFYTLMQGECLFSLLVNGTYDIKSGSVQCQKALLTKKRNWNCPSLRQVTLGHKAKDSERELYSFKWSSV